MALGTTLNGEYYQQIKLYYSLKSGQLIGTCNSVIYTRQSYNKVTLVETYDTQSQFFNFFKIESEPENDLKTQKKFHDWIAMFQFLHWEGIETPYCSNETNCHSVIEKVL